MAEGVFGWSTFLIAAIAVAVFAEFVDLTLSILALCALLVFAVRADDLLGMMWINLVGIKEFFLLRW
ncbi:hypothetical protein H0O03_04040 [Candidatus Micrarchaeota archaeon]|nr:hypothetical protein [Candidatus Micrarchaeota archaeon]